MPTLTMKEFSSRLKQAGRDTHLEVQLHHEPSKDEFKLGRTVYYGYPVEHSGRILAYITSKSFHATPAFNIKDFSWLIGEVKLRDNHDI